MKVFLMLVLFLAAGCASRPVVTSESVAATDASAYVNAQNSEELAQLIRQDLEAHRAAESYTALREFTAKAVQAGDAARAQALFEGARPVVLFQLHGGTSYVNAVKELGAMLARAAGEQQAAPPRP